MKTAKEWADLLNEQNETPLTIIEEARYNALNESQVKQIQLDAWQQGMSDAAQRALVTAQKAVDEKLLDCASGFANFAEGVLNFRDTQNPFENK